MLQETSVRYLLIATIDAIMQICNIAVLCNKCDLSKGRIYFLLAFKTQFTVLTPCMYHNNAYLIYIK